MDYGQNGQSDSRIANSDLFASGLTEGAGVAPESSNPDTNESLHADDASISWQRNPQEVGNKLIGLSSNYDKDRQGDQYPPSVELGVIEPTMPPGATEDLNPEIIDQTKAIEHSFDKTVIKTDDRLDPAALKEINAASSRLDHTGDIADFYDTARNMTVANLTNSFGNNSAWKEDIWSVPVLVFFTTVQD